jgi:glycosyltransferase involved in cell wall biosynthesis
VLFPFFERNWMRHDPPRGIDPRRRVRDAYYHFEWRQRMRTYSHLTSISEFTRQWTNAYWDIDSQVVYPPVDTTSASLPKQDVVLSVGRFSTTGHPKKQEEIIRAFGELSSLHQAGWRHHSIGALTDSPADQAYFSRLQTMAARTTLLLTNVSRAEIKDQFARAKIFVHAAGFGEAQEKPEATEHFGIATVEAMAAGAVPVVVNRGAQPEIVEHGISGFVWDTADEMKRYIAVLATDEIKRQQMATAARARAELFSRRNFLTRMEALLPV